MKREVRRQQRRWAKSTGVAVDDRGYVSELDVNLFRPLTPTTRAAFERGDGTELVSQAKRPAKMRALHSSAALAVNFFDHWVDREAGSLIRALGIDGRLAAPPQFEQRFPTGLAGKPPSLDVVLELESGTVVAIECKFTEWMTPKRRGRPAFKPKYFEGGSRLWERAGLPACQALADDLISGAAFFRLLDAAQLLKHALGLATQRPGRFALYYLYFDSPSPLGERHRTELATFAGRVARELAFEALAYQELFRGLVAQPIDAAYLAYLETRYFPDIA